MITIDITPWDTDTFTAETVAIKIEVTATEESEERKDFLSAKIRIEDISEIIHRNDDAIVIIYESGREIVIKIVADVTVVNYMGEEIDSNEVLETILSTIAFGAPYTPPE